MKKKNHGLSVSKFRRWFFAAVFAVLFLVSLQPAAARALDKTPDEIEKELSDNITDQLGDIDFSKWDEIINALTSDQYKIFGGKSFGDKVAAIINGDIAVDYGNIFSAILSLFFGDIAKLVPLFALIIGIAVLCSMLTGLKQGSARSSNSIIYFACFGAVILTVSVIVWQAVAAARDTVGLLQTQMNIAFPILLTVLTAIGGTSSAAVYQPMVTVLSTLVAQILSYVILPLFIVSFVFNIITNLNPSVKLGKFSGWVASLSKWLIGIVFTVFSGFMAVQGITASTMDGVSIKTAKYAISHYIPIIGGYLSDGFNLIMAGSVLIKNAVGVTAILLLAATVLMPLIQILAIKLGLHLLSAILEPLADSGFSNFCGGAAKSLNILIAIVLGVGFMYFISLMLIIGTGNFMFS